MFSTVLVLGDSVPEGARTTATAWPDRLPGHPDATGVGTVRFHGGMGITVPDLADEAAAAIAAIEDADELVVLVHAGHNDAQSSGDEPRVPEVEFVAAATGLDGLLSEHRQISRHAFVGLVPLLSLEDPGSVPFSEDQPGRSLQYDRALSGAVETHLELARPVADWRDRTTDGVHPNGAGHAAIADRVAAWLGGGV